MRVSVSASIRSSIGNFCPAWSMIAIGLPGITPRPIDCKSTPSGGLPWHVHLIVCARGMLDDDIEFLRRRLRGRRRPFVPLRKTATRQHWAQADAERHAVEVSPFHLNTSQN